MLELKAILNSMKKNGEEFVNKSIIDITTMKNINKRFYNKRRITIKKKQERLEKEKVENPAKYSDREKRRLTMGESIQY